MTALFTRLARQRILEIQVKLIAHRGRCIDRIGKEHLSEAAELMEQAVDLIIKADNRERLAEERNRG